MVKINNIEDGEGASSVRSKLNQVIDSVNTFIPKDPAGYIFGGVVDAEALNKCDEYNPTSNSWSNKEVIPRSGKYLTSVAGIGVKAYLCGGRAITFSQKCDEYDGKEDKWSVKTDMPSPSRIGSSSTAVDKKVYVFGGYTGSYLLDNDEYSPEGNSWVSKMNLANYERGYSSAFTITSDSNPDAAFIIGGTRGAQDFSRCDKYLPQTNTWEIKTEMSSSRHYVASVAIGDKGYAFGGSGSEATSEMYDSVANTWTSKEGLLAGGRQNHAAFAIDTDAYICGGYLTDELQTCHKYDSTTNVWSSSIENLLDTKRQDLAACML